MKKTLSLILAVIMIISAVPLQSFALFDWFYPTVEKVEFADNIPISNKDVQNSAGADIGKALAIELYNNTHSFRIYLSNGKVIQADDYFCSSEELLENGIAYIICSVYVEPDKCAQAIAEGKSVIDVELNVMVKYLDFSNTFRRYYFDAEKELVPEIVKDVRLADAMPESYDEYNPYAAFIGKNFEVEYADGTKETYTLENKGEYRYYLGDKPFSLWYIEDSYEDEATGETVYYEGLELYYVDCRSIIWKEAYTLSL